MGRLASQFIKLVTESSHQNENGVKCGFLSKLEYARNLVRMPPIPSVGQPRQFWLVGLEVGLWAKL